MIKDRIGNIYPNPVFPGADIYVPLTRDDLDLRWIISDLQGNRISDSRQILNSSNNLIRLKAPLEPGLYIVTLLGGEESQTQKIVVIK